VVDTVIGARAVGVVRDDNGVGSGGGVRVEEDDQRQTDQTADDWAAMNPGAEPGAMPAKVSENIRPMVTAGLAKLVELVNQ
jgi:hypothetical protein